jgi:hypothetical protein
VGLYLWRTINPDEDLRFVGAKQPFRGA